MNAIDFIKQHGVDKAREVVVGAPDKTATHYVFRKIPSYYSVEFESWFHDGEWWDSDCYTELNLIDSCGSDFFVNLSVLKRLIEGVELIKRFDDLEQAKAWLPDLDDNCAFVFKDDTCDNRFYKHQLIQAIADYESIYGGEHV